MNTVVNRYSADRTALLSVSVIQDFDRFRIICGSVSISVLCPHSVKNDILRLQGNLRSGDQDFLYIVFLTSRKGIFTFRPAPAHKQLLVAAGKILVLRQRDDLAFFNIGSLCRNSPISTVQVITEGIGLQHIGHIITIFIIAPYCINGYIPIGKGDFRDCRGFFVLPAEYLVHCLWCPSDKYHVFAVHTGM